MTQQRVCGRVQVQRLRLCVYSMFYNVSYRLLFRTGLLYAVAAERVMNLNPTFSVSAPTRLLLEDC